MIGKDEINKLLGLWVREDFSYLSYFFLHEGELYLTEISYGDYLNAALMPLKLQFYGNRIAVYSHLFDIYNDNAINVRCMCPIKKLKTKRGRRKYLEAMFELKRQEYPHHYEEMIGLSDYIWCVQEIKNIIYGADLYEASWRNIPVELLYTVNAEYGSKEVIDFYLNPFKDN